MIEKLEEIQEASAAGTRASEDKHIFSRIINSQSIPERDTKATDNDAFQSLLDQIHFDVRKLSKGMEAKVNAVESKLEANSLEMQARVEVQMGVVENKVGNVRDKMDTMNKKVDTVEEKVGVVEDKVDTKVGDVRDKMDTMNKRWILLKRR